MHPKTALLTALLSLVMNHVLASPTNTVNELLASSPSSADFYRRAHSYDPDYAFDPLHGWEAVDITDLPYKYPGKVLEQSSSNTTSDYAPISPQIASHEKRRSHAARGHSKRGKSKGKTAAGVAAKIGGTVGHLVDSTWNSIKGVGSSQNVVITWYTGNDLKNPSCWSKTDWAPTDASFACALTLHGWKSRPKCFKFLELCNGPKKCIFVRVIDTCAGCAAGSKHVDLTKSAFKTLAALNQGKLNVQMRMATDPKVWHKELWGPKA